MIGVSYADRLDLTYGSDAQMEKGYVQFVSGWMFDAFGIRPAVGRLLSADDDTEPGAHPYAVLSHDYWKQRFGSDPSVVGKTLRIGQTIFQIIGVTEGPFTGTETGTRTGIFVPMAMKNPQTLASWNNFWLRTFIQMNGHGCGTCRRSLAGHISRHTAGASKDAGELDAATNGAILQRKVVRG